MWEFLIQNWKDVMLTITGTATALLLIGEKWRALMREPFKKKQEEVSSKDSELDYLEKIVTSQGKQLKSLIDENTGYFEKAEEQRKKFELLIRNKDAEFSEHAEAQQKISEDLKNLLDRERQIVAKYRKYTRYLEGLLIRNEVSFNKIEE